MHAHLTCVITHKKHVHLYYLQACIITQTNGKHHLTTTTIHHNKNYRLVLLATTATTAIYYYAPVAATLAQVCHLTPLSHLSSAPRSD
jgi:hypothetical protein